MKGISSEIVSAIFQLLPGFIVAWFIYGLTSHLKPSTFERIIQALIYTVLVKSILIIFRFFALFVGENIYAFSTWNSDVEFVWSILIAITVGFLVSWCINNDFPLILFRKDGEQKSTGKFKILHKFFSKIGLTDKTLHPTEWYSAFKDEPRYIVLHLTGERRLYGWTRQYPDDHKKGHFLIEEAEWLLDDGSRAPLYTVKQLLIPSSIVEYIEFSKHDYEIKANKDDIDNANKLLTKLYIKEENDVDKCA
jgi:hypothetical protein